MPVTPQQLRSDLQSIDAAEIESFNTRITLALKSRWTGKSDCKVYVGIPQSTHSRVTTAVMKVWRSSGWDVTEFHDNRDGGSLIFSSKW